MVLLRLNRKKDHFWVTEILKLNVNYEQYNINSTCKYMASEITCNTNLHSLYCLQILETKSFRVKLDQVS